MGSIELLIIDPQNDFCSKNGALYVEGAEDDMKRLADIIDKYGEKISGITISFDMHKSFHIASPAFWVDRAGQHPEPFTVIKKDDVAKGVYSASNDVYENLALDYVSDLESNGRYDLCIWPPHCVVGSEGALLYEPIFEAVERYNAKKLNGTEYIFKTMNPFTEQYSVIKADVNLGDKESAIACAKIMNVVSRSDIILVSGEALSHCVANTVMDIAANNGYDLSKFILIEDTTTNVAGFEYLGEKFIEQASSMGMKRIKSADIGVLFNE